MADRISTSRVSIFIETRHFWAGDMAPCLAIAYPIKGGDSRWRDIRYGGTLGLDGTDECAEPPYRYRIIHLEAELS